MQQHGLINPWDDSNKHETRSKVAEFKYRHKTREGHYEDSLPTLNQDTIKVSLVLRGDWAAQWAGGSWWRRRL